MYGDEPRRWSDDLHDVARTRFIINALTRLRFCTPEGDLEFKAKGSASAPPPGYLPWYDVPDRRSTGQPIAFGHWSALGLVERPDLLALDTGCVWGGSLTAVRVDGERREIVQVKCAKAQEMAD
jgi:bis(5'-nucleosyl)-tetraphosphatase (symmetrical)